MKAIYGPVWQPLPQTAQMAEWVAWMVAHQVVNGPSTLGIDCLGVIRGANKCPPSAMTRSMNWLFAGTRKFADRINTRGWLQPEHLYKIKSHRDIDSAATSEERATIQGNNEADELAAVGRKAHPAIPEAMAELFKQQENDINTTIDLFLALAPLWPEKEGRAGRDLQVATAGKTRKQRADPEAARQKRHRARLLVRKTEGQHRLFAARIGHEEGKMIVFCWQCSGWSTYKCGKTLASACQPPTSRAGKEAKHRLSRCPPVHPKHPSIMLVDVVPFIGGSLDM